MDHGDEDVLVTKRHIKYFERCLQASLNEFNSPFFIAKVVCLYGNNSHNSHDNSVGG